MYKNHSKCSRQAVRFPDLKEKVIVPGTTKLTFNISLSGTDANKTLVKNLGRNVIRKLVVKLEGNEIIILVLMIVIFFIHIMTVGKVRLRGIMLSFKPGGGEELIIFLDRGVPL